MSSRAKKKRLWREGKEKQYSLEKGFYDSVINNLQIMKKDYEEGKFNFGIDLANSIDQTGYIDIKK